MLVHANLFAEVFPRLSSVFRGLAEKNKQKETPEVRRKNRPTILNQLTWHFIVIIISVHEVVGFIGYLMPSKVIGLSGLPRLLAPAPLRKLIDVWPRYRHLGSFELSGRAVNGDSSHSSPRRCIIHPNHKSRYWRVESTPNYQGKNEREKKYWAKVILQQRSTWVMHRDVQR